MRELQERQKIKRRLYSLPVCVLLLLVAGLLAKGALGVVEKQVESAKHVRDLEAQAVALAHRKDDLEAKIQTLDTEEGIVEEIREKFNVSSEGEYVVVIVEESPKEASSTQNGFEWSKGWWESVKNLWQD